MCDETLGKIKSLIYYMVMWQHVIERRVCCVLCCVLHSTAHNTKHKHTHTYNFSQMQYMLPDYSRRPEYLGAILMCILM